MNNKRSIRKFQDHLKDTPDKANAIEIFCFLIAWGLAVQFNMLITFFYEIALFYIVCSQVISYFIKIKDIIKDGHTENISPYNTVCQAIQTTIRV